MVASTCHHLEAVATAQVEEAFSRDVLLARLRPRLGLLLEQSGVDPDEIVLDECLQRLNRCARRAGQHQTAVAVDDDLQRAALVAFPDLEGQVVECQGLYQLDPTSSVWLARAVCTIWSASASC